VQHLALRGRTCSISNHESTTTTSPGPTSVYCNHLHACCESWIGTFICLQNDIVPRSFRTSLFFSAEKRACEPFLQYLSRCIGGGIAIAVDYTWVHRSGEALNLTGGNRSRQQNLDADIFFCCSELHGSRLKQVLCRMCQRWRTSASQHGG
jgi:hypothetical protein